MVTMLITAVLQDPNFFKRGKTSWAWVSVHSSTYRTGTVLNSDLRIAIPTIRLFGPYGFSVTAGSVRVRYLFKTVQQANKKINGTKAALVPSLTFTCYLNSHAAGMISAASGETIPPQFGYVTSVKKKLILKFLAVKKLRARIPIRDFQSKYWNTLRTGLVL